MAAPGSEFPAPGPVQSLRMTLSLRHRRVGDISVFTCQGRIIEGPESARLGDEIGRLLPHEPFIVLDLAGVEFLDSAGLGLLVRMLGRVRAAGGGLKLCALPPRLTEILRMTRLQATLESYPAEAEAIAAFYDDPAAADAGDLYTDILCVDSSPDLLAYVRAVLREAGYGVTTAANIYDALILLRATRPRAVVVGAGLRAARGTESAETFNRTADALPVIELEAGFSSEDAGDAARRLLDRLKDALGSPGRPPR
jgi:anti-sigma B factor antagonist